MPSPTRLAFGIVLLAVGVALAQEFEGPQVLAERARWFAERRLGPDGRIPWDARNLALRQLEANLRNGLLLPAPAGIVGDRWIPLGPSPLEDGTSRFNGRVSAIAVHPTNPSIAFVGGAQGGIWKTVDGGTTWTPLTDQQDSLATGSIAIDPTNTNTLYAGTGEPNGSCDSYFGAGILKSTDGGTNWTLLGAASFDNTSVATIVVHPSTPTTLWAGNTSGVTGLSCTAALGSYGVWKSTNAGTSWNRVLGPAQTQTQTEVHEIIRSPSDPSRLWAAVKNSGVWQTTNGGTSWTKLSGGLPASTSVGRVDLAVDRNNASVLYAAFEDFFTGAHLGTWKSTNGGANWTQLPAVSPGTCHKFNLAGLCTYPGSVSQCSYDFFLDVAPDGNVWVGGLGIWRSPDGGSTWIDVCPPDVHIDQHAVAFASDGTVWVGNDGGAFITGDDGASWTPRNRGLSLAQFYPGAALHPSLQDFATGGTQDNGTLLLDAGDSWPAEYLGDTSYGSIDSLAPNAVRITAATYLALARTTDGGVTWSPAINGLSDANTVRASFIAPMVPCPTDSSILVAGSDNAWRTSNGAASWTSNSPDPIDTSGAAGAAIAFAAADGTCGTYFMGLSNGKLYRTTNAGGAWQEIAGTAFGGRMITDIAVDPTNSNVTFAAVGGIAMGAHLFKSTNALAATPTWTASDTGIPDVPANAVLVDPDSPSTIYVGNDLGVFRSVNGGSAWGTFINGHPKVAVYDLVADSTTKSLLSFTHGRGAFRMVQACTAPTFAGVGGAIDASSCTAGALSVSWPTATSWGSGSTGGTYQVRRFSGPTCLGAFDVVVSGLPASQTSYSDASAPLDTDVSYRVVAVNDCVTPVSTRGTAGCSAAVRDRADTAPCGPVGNTLLAHKSASDVQLTWGVVSCTDLQAYEVYASVSASAPFPSGWTLLGQPTSPSFADPLASTWGFYRVLSRDACGNGSAD